MNKHPDQTEQTKKNIMDAFWQLAKEGGISSVNVSAIMKKAGYNRGTFYVYFSGIPDLVTQTESEIMQEFQAVLKKVLENEFPKDFRIITDMVIQRMKRFEDRIFLLLGKGGDPNFVSMVREEAIRLSPIPFEKEEYVITFILSALTGVLTYWYESGKKDSLEDIIQVTHSLIFNGLHLKHKETL